MISLQLGSPTLEAPKLPQNFPQQLDIIPPFQCTKLALAVAGQLKIAQQDAKLVLVTYVSMETRDDRLLEARVQILRDPCEPRDMDERRKGGQLRKATAQRQ